MRDIKFRGKRTDNGKWVCGFYIKDIWGDGESCYIYYDCEDYEVDPATVGEYTGLKDKNGVEIYEGDILRSSLGWVFPVEWDEENARYIGHVMRDGEWYVCYVGREPAAEVIGNVHDNPELAKEA